MQEDHTTVPSPEPYKRPLAHDAKPTVRPNAQGVRYDKCLSKQKDV